MYPVKCWMLSANILKTVSTDTVVDPPRRGLHTAWSEDLPHIETGIPQPTLPTGNLSKREALSLKASELTENFFSMEVITSHALRTFKHLCSLPH